MLVSVCSRRFIRPIKHNFSSIFKHQASPLVLTATLMTITTMAANASSVTSDLTQTFGAADHVARRESTAIQEFHDSLLEIFSEFEVCLSSDDACVFISSLGLCLYL
jgi:hypothetical protein